MQNLSSQQLSLATSDYDLRITNLARFIYKKLPIKSGTFIDIGAGNGLFLKFFKDKGFKVEGVELEKDQVHAMKRDYKLKDVLIHQGDITNLKGNESYDVVIASDVIEHLEDDKSALSNLYSFVKEDGYLVVTVPAHAYLYGKRDLKWGHFRRYGIHDLKHKIASLPHSCIVDVSYWNIVGYVGYFIYEKIFKKPIREDFRYNNSLISRWVRTILDCELKVEEIMGGTPIGLTLVLVARKNKIV